MIPNIARWSYTLLTTMLLAGIAGEPPVLDLACRHPFRASGIACAWALVGNFLPTPIKKLNGWLG